MARAKNAGRIVAMADEVKIGSRNVSRRTLYHVVGPKYEAGDLLCWDNLYKAKVVTEANWDCNMPIGYDGDLVSLYATLEEALMDQIRHGGRVMAIDLLLEHGEASLSDGSKVKLLTSRAGYPAVEEVVPGKSVSLLTPWPSSILLPPQSLWRPCPYHSPDQCKAASRAAYLE
jgi:hypothetical protein